MTPRSFMWGLVLVCGITIVPILASAEMYIAGQVGYAVPSDLSDIKGTGSSSGQTSTDLALKSNLAYGLKIGGYLPSSLKWLGLEFEGFYTQPDIKAQSATVTSGGVSTTGPVPDTRLRVAHFAVNVLARYPGETFQPYVGIGGGANVAGISENNLFVDETTVAPSLNALAGLRIFLTERIAFFGEYKYNQSKFKFSDNNVEANYRTNMFMGGLSFHFK